MTTPRFLKNPTNKTTLYSIAVIITVAMLVSIGIGMRQSIWFDEAYSIMVAKQQPSEVVRLAGIDTHPPLYYLVLHAWGEAFHWQTLPLRLLSIFGLGGALAAAGLFVRRQFGNRAAMIAVGIAALSPLLLRYGFEIRMYALASCIGMWATYVLACAVDAKAKRAAWLWALYAVLVAIGVYTLYYLALLWIAHAAWLIWRSTKARLSWNWMWAYIGSVLLFLPWLPTFIKQMGNGALAPIGQPMNVENLLGIISFNTLYQPLWQLNVLASVIFIAVGVAIIYGAIYGYRQLTAKEKPYLWLLVAYIAVPVLVLMVISLTRSMYVERYLAHVAIGLMSAVGVCIAVALRRPTPITRIATVIVVTACVVGIINLFAVGNFNFQRMQRPAVNAVSQTVVCNEDSVVVAADPYVMIELAAYLPMDCLHFYSEWETLAGGYAPVNNIPAEFKTRDIPPFAPTLYYVYYDTQKLQTPASYEQTTLHAINGLSVATLTRR